jgi:hypothetical protein
MTNEIKELLDAAILNDQNCIYFAPNSRDTYTVTLWGSIWDVYAITGQELLGAIKANKENYTFDVTSTPYVLYASNENPYITLINIKEKK